MQPYDRDAAIVSLAGDEDPDGARSAGSRRCLRPSRPSLPCGAHRVGIDEWISRSEEAAEAAERLVLRRHLKLLPWPNRWRPAESRRSYVGNGSRPRSAGDTHHQDIASYERRGRGSHGSAKILVRNRRRVPRVCHVSAEMSATRSEPHGKAHAPVSTMPASRRSSAIVAHARVPYPVDRIHATWLACRW